MTNTTPIARKACKKCGVAHPLAFFPLIKNARDGHSSTCKDCRAAYRREHKAKSREKYREYGRRQDEAKRLARIAYRAEFPLPPRAAQPTNAAGGRASYLRTLQYKYGVTVEMWHEMLIGQAGRCAICARPMKRPHVDHDHQTGIVRQLLCSGCNTGLGFFKDNPNNMALAIDYLVAHGRPYERRSQ